MVPIRPRFDDRSGNIDRLRVDCFLFLGKRMVWSLSRLRGRLFGGGIRLLFTTDSSGRGEFRVGIRCEFAGAADANQDSTVPDPLSQSAELVFFEGLLIVRSLSVGQDQHIDLA